MRATAGTPGGTRSHKNVQQPERQTEFAADEIPWGPAFTPPAETITGLLRVFGVANVLAALAYALRTGTEPAEQPHRQLDPLRAVRVEVVLQFLEEGSSSVMGTTDFFTTLSPELYREMQDRGLLRGDVDRALRDLALAGRIAFNPMDSVIFVDLLGLKAEWAALEAKEASEGNQ
jgi:hypothetical protein